MSLTVPESESAEYTALAFAQQHFWSRLEELQQQSIDLWWSCNDELPILGPRRSRRMQRTCARASERLIDDLGRRVESYPEEARSQRQWRQATRERVQRYGEQVLGWPTGFRRMLLGDEYFESTLAFARSARELDPDLRAEDLFQALRNAWIANSIQMLLDLEVRCSPAIFAYSMLYPYTDNTLDDPAVSSVEKHRLNSWLESRLRGEVVPPRGVSQERLDDLIARIEGEYPRVDAAEVHLSLLAIHRGQVRSVEQQGHRQLTEDELLRISVEKGGASVLADGYLTAGRLTTAEAEFIFDYGVVLQLLDDLQDAVVDREARHQTLFSTVPRGQALDRWVSRLYAFMKRVFVESPRFASPAYDDRRDLIHRNCVTLLVGAIAENPTLCSTRFLRQLEARWPLRFAAMRRLRRRGRKVFERRLRSLKRKRSTESLLELFSA